MVFFSRMTGIFGFMAFSKYALAAASSVTAIPTTAPYKVTQIAIPGAYADQAVAITPSGVVLGMYYDFNFLQHGYLYISGVVTPFDFPGAASTNPKSINSTGDIVGYYTDTNGITYGFTYVHKRFFTVGYQGYTTTELKGINDNRLTCGDSYRGYNNAFIYKSGRFRQLDREADGTVSAINNPGDVLALIANQPAIYHGGKLTYLPVTGGVGSGMNDKDEVVGYLTDGTAAFSYYNGSLEMLSVKGARQTTYNAINSNGLIAGAYEDAQFNQFAFVKNGSQLMQLPTIGDDYVTPNAINDSGVVVGAYFDSGNVSRSFVAIPRH